MPQQRKAYQAFFDAPEVAEFDKFRREQPEILSIAETLRRLVKRGLAASGSGARKRDGDREQAE
jgi:hypothetical protein